MMVNKNSILTLGLVLILAAATIIPTSSAQETVGRFYVTADPIQAGPTACHAEVPITYAGSMEEPSPGKVYAGASALGYSCAFWVEYVVEEAFTLSGDVDVEFWVGCEVGSATIELDYALYIAGQEIIYERPPVTGTCAAGDTLVKGGGSHPSAGASAKPGDLVQMRFNFFSGPEPGLVQAGNVFMTVGGDNPSGFTAKGLPTPGVDSEPSPVDPVTHFDEISEDDVAIQHGFDDPTSDTYIFNWTTGFDAVNVTSGAAVENGSFELTILDGEGITVLQQAVTESFESADVFEGVVPGNWTITVEYSDFVGSFFLTIEEREDQPEESPAGNDNGPAPPTSTDDGPEQNDEETITLDEGEEKKGLPGFGILALLAGLGIALTARRRV